MTRPIPEQIVTAVAALAESLATWCEAGRDGRLEQHEAAETRRVERAYFASRVDRMDYPSLRLDGLPIGSGAIESAADHVVQRRMKRAGMRWSVDGGDAILALRSRRPLAA